MSPRRPSPRGAHSDASPQPVSWEALNRTGTLGIVTARVACILAQVTILVTSCTGNAPIATRSPLPSVVMPSPGRITWSDCGGGYKCGNLSVPLDYANPADDKISIGLMKKPATDPTNRIGSLLLNPGGPGASGITFLQSFIKPLAQLNKRFDLIGFDPRGVGRSSPIRCLDGPEMDAFVALDSVWDDQQEKQAGIQAVKDYVAACERQSARVLPFVDTESAVRDMELIRGAVGDSKLTYFGASYGTLLGQIYAHLFPTHVRALALDGVIDPSVSTAESDLAQATAFQSNLQAFLAACRARKSGADRCQYAANGDPEQKLSALMNRLDVTPLMVGNRVVTRSIALNGVLVGLYDQSNWPYLDVGLVLAERGNGAGLLTLSDAYYQRNGDGTYNNLTDANYAINCLDHPVVKDLSYYDGLATRFNAASPLFGPFMQYDWLPCVYWPAKATRQPSYLDAPGAPPILLVGGTNDPATPYKWAQAVHAHMTNSVLLTRNGNGHTSYESSPCAHAAEDAYLINLTLPANGTVCT